MSKPRTTILRLRELRSLLSDSHKGYEQAAIRVREPHLRHLLSMMANGRLSMITDIDLQLGRRAPRAGTERGTFTGSLHRGWMNVRHALMLLPDVALLAECERGETYIREAYVAAWEMPGISDSTRELLMRHHSTITSNLEEIGFLRDVRDKRVV